MLKHVIMKNGLIKSPVELDRSILLFSENSLLNRQEEGDRILSYLDWVPFLYFLVIIKDLVQGKRISLQPVIEY